jgi:hypothetical protein
VVAAGQSAAEPRAAHRDRGRGARLRQRGLRLGSRDQADIGRLRLDEPFAAHVLAAGFEPLPITFEHAAEAGSLPRHHADPFDRMLVAQARVERLTLVTHDDVFEAYDIETLRG